MANSDSILERLYYGREQLGPFRFMLVMLCVSLVVAGLLVTLFVEDYTRILQVMLAMTATASGAFKLMDRPKPDWLLGSIMLVGAAILWAQVFGLIRYPLNTSLAL